MIGLPLYRCISFDSYIKPQLLASARLAAACCISFESYIKPQLIHTLYNFVVGCISFESYIKPQLWRMRCISASGCISFESYIKPQLIDINKYAPKGCISFESYIKPQRVVFKSEKLSVVYLLNPTSNHNSLRATKQTSWLYIFWILHQTTTCCNIIGNFAGCISFESYIKPQHAGGWQSWLLVVYLLNPTSNHNLSAWLVCIRMLYIFWILHQTTTPLVCPILVKLLYIFWILHQTTTIPCKLCGA